MANHLQAQWALDSAINGTMTVSRGLLHAATTDGVQPTALVTSEQFGMTLPICLETKCAIEQLARPPAASTVLTFIKAQIGYAAGDSAEYLCRNEGGVKFLCLAAALCSITPFQGAQVIEGLLKETPANDQLRPTIFQWKMLLQALSFKLARSAFMKNVVGWQLLLAKEFSRCDLVDDGASVPGIQEIIKLVLALIQRSRLGPEGSILIQTCLKLLPWTIAFVKWFLGMPPAVVLRDGLEVKSLVQAGGSTAVFVLVDQAFELPHSYCYSVSVQQSIKSLSVLLDSDDSEDEARKTRDVIGAKGLLDAKTWLQFQVGKLMLRLADGETKLEGLCVENMLYSIMQNLMLTISAKGRPVCQTISQHYKHPAPFSHPNHLLEFAEEILSSRINELETFPVCVRKLKKLLHSPRGNDIPFNPQTWLTELSFLAVDLLSLSLFFLSSGLERLPYIPLTRSRTNVGKAIMGVIDELSQTALQYLKDDKGPQKEEESQMPPLSTKLHPRDLYSHVVGLLGFGGDPEKPIMFCVNGETVYPAILESESVAEEGYLRLTSLRGRLYWDRAPYSEVRARNSTHLSESPYTTPYAASYDSQYVVGVEDGFLTLGLGVKVSTGKDFSCYWDLSPFDLWDAHATALSPLACKEGHFTSCIDTIRSLGINNFTIDSKIASHGLKAPEIPLRISKPTPEPASSGFIIHIQASHQARLQLTLVLLFYHLQYTFIVHSSGCLSCMRFPPTPEEKPTYYVIC